MSEILFKCSCPAYCCTNSEIYTWRHGECPSDSSYYISDEGILRCDYCNKKFPLFSRRWKSSSCNHEYTGTNLKKALNIFTAMLMENSISADFLTKIKQNLITMESQFK